MSLFSTISSRYNRFKLKNSPQTNLVYGFLVYVLVGWSILLLPFLQKTYIPVVDNLFIATSAISTTGLVTVSIYDSYNFFGQFIIMILFQIGGIGYMTFTTFYLLSTTKRITHWHKKIIQTEFDVPKELKIKDFLRSVIIYTIVMEVLGAICFFIAFKREGIQTFEALWSSIFHSVSAFCTAGFGLNNNSFMDFTGNSFINIIISVLAICGSLGFIVVTDIWYRLSKRTKEISFTTKMVSVGFLILLAFGMITTYFFEPLVQELQGQEKLWASFFQAMTSMTTVGFNTIDTGGLSLPILLMVIFLMYIGASPAGTAGGMKITTLTAMLAIIKSRLYGEKEITFLKRKIPFERLYVATSTFIFYTMIIFFTCFLLSFTETADFKNILFEVASALGTVGLSVGLTGELTTFGKLVFIVIMFVGRLGVITFGYALLARKLKD
ncbi:potassium transporter TrkG [Aquimarina gracilis]|uniref:Potassium transporter TrkG n=1 Tax=Aquimarina gracilis TaxID=874422 RepID=A0ABU5ZVS8_9FLAO|nr:potassium transporter TrkG [Aquimarina gracilis]MEB3345980.1 potassium transporter TrkG [Aquimarina gracilis]